MQSSRYLIGFSYEKYAGRRDRHCFLWDNSCRKMYTIFSAMLRQQRKSDVMTSFSLTTRSAVYYKADSSIVLTSSKTGHLSVQNITLTQEIIMDLQAC
jgi:hypothetical protein